MKKSSFLDNLIFGESKPKIDLLFETDHSKEIRIAMDVDQAMKEHKTPFPITIQIVQGEIDFGVNGEKQRLQAGDIIALEGGVPHDLRGVQRSVVRLSLSKMDSAERVQSVN